jgi:hypothetical protein
MCACIVAYICEVIHAAELLLKIGTRIRGNVFELTVSILRYDRTPSAAVRDDPPPRIRNPWELLDRRGALRELRATQQKDLEYLITRPPRGGDN